MAFLRECSYDPMTGETRRWYFDGKNIVRTKTVDLKPVVDQCKIESDSQPSFDPHRVFHKVATIPPIFIEKLMTDHHVDVFADDPREVVRLERVIETHYPLLKTHQKKIWRPT